MHVLAAIALVLTLFAAPPATGESAESPGARRVVPSGDFQLRPELLEKVQEKEAPKAIQRAPKEGLKRMSPALQRRPGSTPSLGPAQKVPNIHQVTPGMIAVQFPDLTVSTKAPPGSSTYYDFTIRNDGKAPAGPTKFEISLGPPCSPHADTLTQRKTLKRYDVKALAVTTSSSLAFKVGHDLGSWAGTGCTLSGKADADGAVLEANETNNAASIATAYHPKPDLVIAWDHSGDGPHSTKFGVKNVGDAPAGASTLHMFCSNSAQSVVAGNAFWPCDPQGPVGQKTWNWSIPGLAPGQKHMLGFPLSATNPQNTTWNATCDYGQAVAERNEKNNGASNVY